MRYVHVHEFRCGKDLQETMPAIACAFIWALSASFKHYLDYRKAIKHEDAKIEIAKINASAHDKAAKKHKTHHEK